MDHLAQLAHLTQHCWIVVEVFPHLRPRLDDVHVGAVDDAREDGVGVLDGIDELDVRRRCAQMQRALDGRARAVVA
jgi:hypothetical protein